MPSDPGDDELRKWHRRFAIDANNRAWQLAEQRQRSAAQDVEMQQVAHASAWHWTKVGTAHNAALADMLLAQVHALLGHGALALPRAEASYAYFTKRGSAPWELAFAEAVLAHAVHAAGDDARHRAHYHKACVLGAALASAEERNIFDATLRTIPPPPGDADMSGGV